MSRRVGRKFAQNCLEPTQINESILLTALLNVISCNKKECTKLCYCVKHDLKHALKCRKYCTQFTGEFSQNALITETTLI